MGIRVHLSLCLFFLSVVAVCVGGARPWPENTKDPTRILVRLKSGSDAHAIQGSWRPHGGHVLKTFHIVPNLHLLQIPAGTDPAAALALLRSDPNVMYAEIDQVRWTLETVPDDPSFSQSEHDAIQELLAQGILFIAAAGNDGFDNDFFSSYPANHVLPNVLSVAASTNGDNPASFTCVGSNSVHVAAPGYRIYSTVLRDGYATYSGTSMAAPHVTGLVALLKAQDPTRDWAALRNLVLTGGDAVRAGEETVSGRRINAAGAMTCSGQHVLNRVLPSGEYVVASPQEDLLLAVENIECAQAGSGPVEVDTPEGRVDLLDDGLGGDDVRGDGIFSAEIQAPINVGADHFAFPGGDDIEIRVCHAYGHRVVEFNYEDTSSGTTLVPTNVPGANDEYLTEVDSDFPIFFGGCYFDSVRVSDNGFLSLGKIFYGYEDSPIPIGLTDSLIAPLKEDLTFWSLSRTRNILAARIGVEPHRKLVIEWRGVGAYECHGGDARFQVVFEEGSRSFRFNYLDLVFDNAGCASQIQVPEQGRG